MLRIIAGHHRGRKMETAPGDAIRPTAERAREAIFNRLTHGLVSTSGAALTGIRVLDVFAGTGALGFEALSRGADHVTFFENDAPAAQLIKRNAERLEAGDSVAVLRRDATHPGPARAKAGLVLMDAPYRSGLSAATLSVLREGGWLTDDAVAVVEVGRDEELAPPDGFAVIDDRRYGAARVYFLRCQT
ncbi:MAG: 16S rRNA (guanine(966)-N(2))-methyltransferase RsmD [Proteobacteria bacterium]|nr:16S rRNA (guanine(966)-N(2))-methyltransferase RsmD [Pseudomonadota bacterium]MDA1058264.1 16S rRNA (guanine(966)-N(2))-methyltransferase RsmD [Pseudomonadota bacterium]